MTVEIVRYWNEEVRDGNGGFGRMEEIRCKDINWLAHVEKGGHVEKGFFFWFLVGDFFRMPLSYDSS